MIACKWWYFHWMSNYPARKFRIASHPLCMWNTAVQRSIKKDFQDGVESDLRSDTILSRRATSDPVWYPAPRPQYVFHVWLFFNNRTSASTLGLGEYISCLFSHKPFPTRYRERSQTPTAKLFEKIWKSIPLVKVSKEVGVREPFANPRFGIYWNFH